MANILQQVALPQETLTVDGEDYLVTAMPATSGLQFMEKHQASIDSGKTDLSVMKEVVVKYVSKDNKAISNTSFDIIFARRMGHLGKLYKAYLDYNFEDVFTDPAGEE
jgi:hypothetical protein